MKIYKTQSAIVIEKEQEFYSIEDDWNCFINDDHLSEKLFSLVQSAIARRIGPEFLDERLLAPVGAGQELWACGVTYLRSKIGRQEESKDAGGGDFYAKVYEAERPEVFFKANPHRIVGPYGHVNIRKDSTWDVPEPELTLVVTSSGKIAGYSIGNDMSSRSIEGENPLYLPQAKTYDGCAAIGPCIYVNDEGIDPQSTIRLEILRNKQIAFQGEISINQMKRSHEELVSYVYRECSFPNGCLIMTGTGIVPPADFTVRSGDEIRISLEPIGTLINTVR